MLINCYDLDCILNKISIKNYNFLGRFIYVGFICVWISFVCRNYINLAKCGIKKTDSHVATALRTIVVLIFSWLMVFIVHSQNQISTISTNTWIFLILSGFATGLSWLCYFKALQLGDG